MTEKYDRSYFEGRVYKGLYRDFPVHYVTARKIHDLIINYFFGKKSIVIESCIDIGGARGFVAKHLENKDYKVAVMDVSEYCRQNRVVEDFRLHDITKVPYPCSTQEFGLAYSVAVLEHIPEDKLDDVIHELARISACGIHGITLNNIPNATDDESHESLHDLEWWKKRFHDVEPNYQVVIMDKEELEHGGSINDIPKLDGLVKLNLGSFMDMYHYGWINVDMADLANFAANNHYNFIRGNLLEPLPYCENTVDIILLSHVLEHFTREEAERILKDCMRVMKDGAIIRIAVPDTAKLIAMYVNGELPFLTDVTVEQSKYDAEILGKILFDNHKCCWDRNGLKDFMETIGFQDVEVKSAFRSKSEVIRKQTISTHPEVSLYIEGVVRKVKVVKVYSGAHKDKLNIGIISTPMLTVPPQNYGGLEQIVADIAEPLSMMGHKVTVFAPEGSKLGYGVNVVQVGKAMGTVQCDWLNAEKIMYEAIKDQLKDFDIIHGHNWFGLEYAYKASHPEAHVLHTHHGGMNPQWWKQSNPPFKLNIIAISRWMQNLYGMMGIPSRVVYNGVNPDKYPFQKEKGDRLLFVGRLDRFKQPHIAIQVAKALNMGLDIVGGTFVQDMAYLEDIRKQCDGKQIVLHTDVNHEEKVKLYQNAKCTLFPSKMGEPFGLIVPESNLCGTPVVALADGAIPETLVKGGYVCSDVDSMIDAVKHIKTITPTVCRKNGMRFSRDIMAVNYLEKYRSVIEGDEW